MITITFKSMSENYRAESLDWKRCTIRRFDACGVYRSHEDIIRQDALDDWIVGKITDLQINLKNTNGLEECSKKVTYVQKWEGYYIISW